MFGKMTTAIPLLSAIALAILTVFNVGYFSKVGLRFSGIVDLSNMVYSFALAFGAVGLIVALCGRGLV